MKKYINSWGKKSCVLFFFSCPVKEIVKPIRIDLSSPGSWEETKFHICLMCFSSMSFPGSTCKGHHLNVNISRQIFSSAGVILQTVHVSTSILTAAQQWDLCCNDNFSFSPRTPSSSKLAATSALYRPLIRSNTPELNTACLPFVKTLNASCPPHSCHRSRPWSAVVATCAHICVCVCGASEKTSVSAWPGCQAEAAPEIPPVLTNRAERLSAPLNHWLQRKSLSLWVANVSRKECLRLSFTLPVFMWVRDRVWDGMQRSYGGRKHNLLSCIFGGEREYPACSLNFIFLPLFIQSWLTEHTCIFFFFCQSQLHAYSVKYV